MAWTQDATWRRIVLFVVMTCGFTWTYEVVVVRPVVLEQQPIGTTLVALAMFSSIEHAPHANYYARRIHAYDVSSALMEKNMASVDCWSIWTYGTSYNYCSCIVCA